jgi:DNA-binding CsgD family transcriptional regulator
MKTLSGVTANAIAEQFGLSNKTIYALKKMLLESLEQKYP